MSESGKKSFLKPIMPASSEKPPLSMMLRQAASAWSYNEEGFECHPNAFKHARVRYSPFLGPLFLILN